MIRFENVSKLYRGHIRALSNITVQIKDGDFVFLIGPSGAGKTTLLRLLIHDLIPSEGDIYVDDWHVNQIHHGQVHLLRRYIGTVFQDFKLIIDRTVFENVAVGLEILGKSDDEIEKEVMDVLNIVDLSEKRSKFPRELATGEMQRTAIARAIVGGPKVLLADEPTGNLDPETSADIIRLLMEINTIGTTVIMATHNVSVVNHLGKRTILLAGGKVISDEEKGKYLVQTQKKHHREKTDPNTDTTQKEKGKHESS